MNRSLNQDFQSFGMNYYQFRHHLYTVDGVIRYKDCVIIPPSLHKHILTVLHSAHQGVTSMTARAEATVFWHHCHASHQWSLQPHGPITNQCTPTPTVQPADPFQCVCADFFTYKGVNYLVIVDRYSNWPIVKRAQDGSKGLINSLRPHLQLLGSQANVQQTVVLNLQHL